MDQVDEPRDEDLTFPAVTAHQGDIVTAARSLSKGGAWQQACVLMTGHADFQSTPYSNKGDHAYVRPPKC